MKTNVSRFLIALFTCVFCASVHAGTPPTQKANSINVNCIPVSAVEPPASSCKVSYEVIGGWCNGFIATITIQNKGTAPLKGWAVRWNYSGNQAVVYSWNGNAVQSGKTVTVSNASCNQTIAPGCSVSFSLQACYSGTNTNPTTFTFE